MPNLQLPKQNWEDSAVEQPNQSQHYLVCDHHGHPVECMHLTCKYF